MMPKFFPWLFDDENAWAKAFADPRYSYELPLDYFMAIYQVERKANNVSPAANFALPELSTPIMPIMPAPGAEAFAPAPAQAQAQVFLSAAAMAPVPEPKQEESKHEDGVLSQEEIDALLSGL